LPAKKTQITDADRAKNMKALAREVGASEDPDALDAALRKIAERQPEPGKAKTAKQ
jgi:hypothetical protein